MEKASIRCCMLEKSGFKVLRSALGISNPFFRDHFHFIPEVIMVIVNTDTYRIFRTRLSLGRRSFEVAGLTKRLLLQELRGWYFSYCLLSAFLDFIPQISPAFCEYLY